MHRLVNAVFGGEPWTEETEITRQRMLELLQRSPFRPVSYSPLTDRYTYIPRT